MSCALSLMAPVALAATLSNAGGGDPQGERAALFRVDSAFAQAAAAKDVEKTLSFWADDATVLPAGQPPVVGREALRRFVTESFALPGFSIQWKTTEFVLSASGDMAYGLGTNKVTFNGPQGQLASETARAVTVWRKGASGWKCVVDIWNEGPPAPAPVPE